LQRDVAERIGVDTATVTNWERDHTAPEFRWLPAIVDFLGYDPRPRPATIGQALIRHREGQGISQEQFARMLRVDPGTLARWEREERVPAGDYLERVRALLACGVR
jgi:transcriptional regulator with XRE-family HTH domain